MPILKPGVVDDDGNWLDLDVMAKYMDDALPPPDDPEDSGKAGRRPFFIAISTGVIAYLRAHGGDGFQTYVDGNNIGRVKLL